MQAGHQGEFAHGLTEWLHARRDSEGRIVLTPEAEAASEHVAELFLMWKAIARSKFKK